tara:strand:+ start:1160 stop:3619 length:2460 start_codon:yes stop_codon:yes gene_type:complete
MLKLDQQIKVFFVSFSGVIYRRPWIAILAMLLLATALASQLPKIKMATAIQSFFHENDPDLIKFNEFQEQFGRDDIILLALNHQEIFSLEFLNKLKALHNDIENTVPNLSDITSIINVRSTRGEKDELIVEDLMEDWPKNSEEIEIIKQRAMSNPTYKNMLLSEDGKFTSIIIELNPYSTKTRAGGEQTLEEDPLAGFDDDPGAITPETETSQKETENQEYLNDKEKEETVITLMNVISKYEKPDFPIYLGGSPVMDIKLKKNLRRDMGLFMGLAFGIIIITLFLLFRRVSGVLLTLMVVILSLLSTFGLMALLGVPITIPTQILPSFLLAVGIADSVHILSLFYRRLEQGDNKEAAITFALGHSGRAIVLTSLTTSGALMSFITSDLAPVAHLGVFAPIGVMLALLFTLVLLPALLAVIPLRLKINTGKHKGLKTGALEKILLGFGNFAIKYPRGIVIMTLLLVFVSLAAALGLHFSYDPLSWLPESSTIRRDTAIIDRNLKGSISLEVVLDTGKENGWHEPELLNKLEMMGREAEQYTEGNVFVGKTTSPVNIIKEINQALNENRATFYSIPEDKNLVSQEFFLFETSGSDDLEDVVDSQFSKARLTMKLPSADAVEYIRFMEVIQKRFKDVFSGKSEITITGRVALLFKTINSTIISMAKSYVLAFIVISLLMVLLMGNVKMGLISMIPNLAPIILTLGLMRILDIPLDAFTLLIGSIAIGLVVDDTIHFMDNFKHYYHETKDVGQAIHSTLQTTGRAILSTSMVLSGSFFVYIASSMNNLVNFGLLTGFAILAAMIADFLLLPALMVLVNKEKEV